MAIRNFDVMFEGECFLARSDSEADVEKTIVFPLSVELYDDREVQTVMAVIDYTRKHEQALAKQLREMLEEEGLKTAQFPLIEWQIVRICEGERIWFNYRWGDASLNGFAYDAIISDERETSL